jgi:hypothetical protein
MGHKCNLLAPLPIGIGSPLAEAPSHTTGHAGPHPAIRLIKAELSNVPPSELCPLTMIPACQDSTLPSRHSYPTEGPQNFPTGP